MEVNDQKNADHSSVEEPDGCRSLREEKNPDEKNYNFEKSVDILKNSTELSQLNFTSTDLSDTKPPQDKEESGTIENDKFGREMGDFTCEGTPSESILFSTDYVPLTVNDSIIIEEKSKVNDKKIYKDVKDNTDLTYYTDSGKFGVSSTKQFEDTAKTKSDDEMHIQNALSTLPSSELSNNESTENTLSHIIKQTNQFEENAECVASFNNCVVSEINPDFLKSHSSKESTTFEDISDVMEQEPQKREEDDNSTSSFPEDDDSLKSQSIATNMESEKALTETNGSEEQSSSSLTDFACLQTHKIGNGEEENDSSEQGTSKGIMEEKTSNEEEHITEKNIKDNGIFPSSNHILCHSHNTDKHIQTELNIEETVEETCDIEEKFDNDRSSIELGDLGKSNNVATENVAEGMLTQEQEIDSSIISSFADYNISQNAAKSKEGNSEEKHQISNELKTNNKNPSICSDLDYSSNVPNVKRLEETMQRKILKTNKKCDTDLFQSDSTRPQTDGSTTIQSELGDQDQVTSTEKDDSNRISFPTNPNFCEGIMNTDLKSTPKSNDKHFEEYCQIGEKLEKIIDSKTGLEHKKSIDHPLSAGMSSSEINEDDSADRIKNTCAETNNDSWCIIDSAETNNTTHEPSSSKDGPYQTDIEHTETEQTNEDEQESMKQIGAEVDANQTEADSSSTFSSVAFGIIKNFCSSFILMNQTGDDEQKTAEWVNVASDILRSDDECPLNLDTKTVSRVCIASNVNSSKDEVNKAKIKHPITDNMMRDSEIKTLEDALEYFKLTADFQILETSLEDVRRNRKSREQHERELKKLDKKIQRLSILFHPDKNKRGSDAQTALNATRTVLKMLSKIFMEDLNIDHKYEFYTKLSISTLGNDKEIKQQVYEVIFKIGVISEIKQENISEIRKFLIESKSCVRSYMECRIKDFEKHRDSALYHLKCCIQGYKKLCAEIDVVENECKDEKSICLYSSIRKMAEARSQELKLLRELRKVAKKSLTGSFQIFDTSERMDDYFVLPFVCYINVILMCDAMVKYENQSIWTSRLPRSEYQSCSSEGTYFLKHLYYLTSFCTVGMTVKTALRNMNKETAKKEFDDILRPINNYMEDIFTATNYAENSPKGYLMEELMNCMTMMSEFQSKKDEVSRGIKNLDKKSKNMDEKYEKLMKETEEINRKVMESLAQCKTLTDKTLVALSEKL